MTLSTTTIGIWADESNLIQQTENELKTKSQELGFPITDKADLLLLKTSSGWKLLSQVENLHGEIFIDFVEGKNAQRKKYPGVGKQPLARAIGLKKGQRPTILDATAGLGGDAYLLASLGCKVWLTERNPVVAALLQNALHRAQKSTETSPIFSESMLFVGKDIDQARTTLNEIPDVIYLDPMYPKPNKKRSANVKKEMQILRHLLSADKDANEWLEKARSWSKKVVVKRPAWAESLANDVHGCIESKNHRYDIFLGKN